MALHEHNPKMSNTHSTVPVSDGAPAGMSMADLSFGDKPKKLGTVPKEADRPSTQIGTMTRFGIIPKEG